MKKTLMMSLALIGLTSGLVSAQSSEVNEAYIKAMTAQAPAQKAQML